MTKEQMQKAGYYGAFGDCYRYLQRFCEVFDDEQYWNAAAKEASEIPRWYDGTPASRLTTSVLLAIYDELQRRYDVKYKGGTQ